MKLFLMIFITFLFIDVFSQSSNNTKINDNAKVVYYSSELNTKVIVQLKRPPINKSSIGEVAKRKYKTQSKEYVSLKDKLISDEKDLIDKEHSEFKEDFNQIIDLYGNRSKSTAKLLHEYKSVFNGFALIADSFILEKIKQLPYIHNVFEDKVISISDLESNEIIDAPKMWNQLNATGKNIKIGILDTGIDPNHPEMVGKVIGGYDFVNSDTDPMDDNGHGTHVAGIAAANGPLLKGVAPDARLVAVKVCNAQGQGYWSNIIAGINYAVDPDNNPLTDDGVDILNLSLSGPGDPSDPLSQAVNSAFNNDVLCVVAAGNSGSGYYTIGTPGCAQNALTIGASDKTDRIAYFSSRGPIVDANFIKPDVIAPGVSIYSCITNNQYVNKDGTSMSTPHVSGAAALLKELHPNWTAVEIKASLIQTAIDIGEDIWTQGKGRVNIFKANEVRTLAIPGLVNFGNIDENQTTWSSTKSINLRAISAQPEVYSLSIQGNFPQGISFSYPSSITLNGNESKFFDFSVSINNQQISFPIGTLPCINGFLILNSAASSEIRIPFSMTKIKSVKLNFDVLPNAVVVHDNISKLQYHFPLNLNYDLIIENDGYYDIIACFDGYNTYVVKEQVYLQNATILNLSSTEATNTIIFEGLDINGKKIPIVDISPERLVTKDNDLGLRLSKLFIGYDNPPLKIAKKFSTLSDRYTYEMSPISFPSWNAQKQFYFFPFGISSGVFNSNLISNNPSDFIKINRRYPKNLSSLKAYNSKYFYSSAIGGMEIIDLNDENKYLDSTSTFTEFILPLPYRNFSVNNKISTHVLLQKSSNVHLTNDSTIYRSSFETILEGNKLNFGYNWSNDLELDVFNKEYTIDYTSTPILFHSYNNIKINANTLSYVKRATYFTHPYFDINEKGIKYKIYTQDSVYKTGNLLNGVNHFSQNAIESLEIIPEKKYCFEFNFDGGNINEVKSKATAQLYFDSRTPYLFEIKSLLIRSGDKITNELNCQSNNVVEVNCYSYNVRLFYKEINDNNWSEILVTKFNDLSTGLIPKGLKNGYYSLKVRIDYLSDSLITINEPAFKILGNCNQIKPQLSAGYSHNMFIKPDGTLWGWGSNNQGDLGDGTNINRLTPTQIGDENNWKSVATGIQYSIAIKTDGTLWGSGMNKGNLGDGTKINRNTFVQIGTDSNWEKVACNQWNSYAIKKDKTLWAWGINDNGQLGDGTKAERLFPVQIGTDSDWEYVAAGNNFAIALKMDKTLWSWGSNQYGQLGTGDIIERLFPVRIDPVSDWKEISAGLHYGIALKSDGSLWGWGNNSRGNLGDGTTIFRYSPMKIGSDFDWKSVSAGRGAQTLGLKNNGDVYAWGCNVFGHLGDGTKVDRYSPTLVPNLTNCIQIAAGGNFSVILKSDYEFCGTGINSAGQLGDGSITSKTIFNCIEMPSNLKSATPEFIISELNNFKNSGPSYLLQNFPNPFRRFTTVKCFLADGKQNAKIVLLNFVGEVVKEFEVSGIGNLSFDIDMDKFPPGIYPCFLYVNGFKVDSKKLVLLPY